MTNRLTPLVEILTQNTVLEKWFSPLKKSLEKVRYSENIFTTLTMPAFLLLGGLRQLQSHQSLREQVQSLMHHGDAHAPPLARSTWSDALASAKRRDIHREVFCHLVSQARISLPDRFLDMPTLDNRDIIAIDASYQTESAHYKPTYPMQGGTDNQKSHMLMTFYDLRKGIPVDVKTETTSMGEMRVIKEGLDHSQWMEVKNALYSVDRAFMDARYWDERKARYKATIITRFKSNTSFQVQETLPVSMQSCNEGVILDMVVSLNKSKQPWRRIEFTLPTGEHYAYLSNDFSLEPGELAFIYHRRWDEEKYFDNYKNNLASTKAWGKSPVSIEQQALIGITTYILTRLFLEQQYDVLELAEKNTTQLARHKKKVALYKKEGGIYLRAYWAKLAKIPVQVWRFLKNCFMKQSSSQLYERQLRPLLTHYL